MMRPLLLSNTTCYRGAKIPLRSEKVVGVEGMVAGDKVVVYTGKGQLVFDADGEQSLPDGLETVQAERCESVGSEVNVWVT